MCTLYLACGHTVHLVGILPLCTVYYYIYYLCIQYITIYIYITSVYSILLYISPLYTVYYYIYHLCIQYITIYISPLYTVYYYTLYYYI